MTERGRRKDRQAGRRPDAARRAARSAFFDQAKPMTRYVMVEAKGGLSFFVNTRDRLGRRLFEHGWRQDFGHLKWAVTLLRQHGLDPAGTTFVDVGANIGTTTISALCRHGFARAVALEPEPENFRTLRLNLVANDVDDRVAALRVAVADQAGEVDIALERRTSGTHHLAFRPEDQESGWLIRVPAVTMDELVGRGTLDPASVGLMWIDTVGAGGLVLAGASSLLAAGVPVVTAVRPTQPWWPEAKELLIGALGDYTLFANIRFRQAEPGPDLRRLLDSLENDADVLAFRR